MATPAQNAQSETARRRILESAGEVFSTKGFQAATVREICQAADVNIAAISYYFEDKASLYQELLKFATEFERHQYPLPDWSEETSSAQKLQDVLLVVMRRLGGVDAVSWHSKLIMRELLQPTEFCRELSQDHFRPHFELMLNILNDILPAETPDYVRLQTAQSIFGQCVAFRLTSEASRLVIGEESLKSHYSPEDLAAHIARFTLAALGVLPPLSSPPLNSPNGSPRLPGCNQQGPEPSAN